MFALTCQIDITREGKKVTSFQTVSEITIKHSLYNLSSTAMIKLPLATILKYTGGQDKHTEELKKILKNDKVVIKLGYNNDLRTEFTGYVKRHNYSSPGSLECENMYLKMRSNYEPCSGENVKLKDIFNTVFPDVEIAHCVDLTIKNPVKNEETSGELFMRQLKRDYNLCMFFDLDEKLHIGQPADLGLPEDVVKYRLGHNVIKNDELKYHYTDDDQIKVKATCYLKDGEPIEVEVGEDGGEKKAVYFYDVEDQSQLRVLAEAELERYQSDGYRGKLTTFLQPYAFPGMTADIEDPDFADNKGRFLIEDTEVSYSKSGGRRKIGIGVKLD